MLRTEGSFQFCFMRNNAHAANVSRNSDWRWYGLWRHIFRRPMALSLWWFQTRPERWSPRQSSMFQESSASKRGIVQICFFVYKSEIRVSFTVKNANTFSPYENLPKLSFPFTITYWIWEDFLILGRKSSIAWCKSLWNQDLTLLHCLIFTSNIGSALIYLIWSWF